MKKLTIQLLGALVSTTGAVHGLELYKQEGTTLQFEFSGAVSRAFTAAETDRGDASYMRMAFDAEHWRDSKTSVQLQGEWNKTPSDSTDKNEFRQLLIAFKHVKFGSLQLGRQVSPVASVTGFTSGLPDFKGDGLGRGTDRYGTERTNGGIQYLSPSFSALTGSARQLQLGAADQAEQKSDIGFLLQLPNYPTKKDKPENGPGAAAALQLAVLPQLSIGLGGSYVIKDQEQNISKLFDASVDKAVFGVGAIKFDSSFFYTALSGGYSKKLLTIAQITKEAVPATDDQAAQNAKTALVDLDKSYGVEFLLKGKLPKNLPINLAPAFRFVGRKATCGGLCIDNAQWQMAYVTLGISAPRTYGAMKLTFYATYKYDFLHENADNYFTKDNQFFSSEGTRVGALKGIVGKKNTFSVGVSCKI